MTEFYSIGPKKVHEVYSYQANYSSSWMGHEVDISTEDFYIRGKKTKDYYLVFRTRKTTTVVDTGAKNSNKRLFCDQKVMVLMPKPKGRGWKRLSRRVIKKRRKTEPNFSMIPKNKSKKTRTQCEDVW